MAQAALRAAGNVMMPRKAVIFAPPLPETRFVVDAAGRKVPDMGRTTALLDVLAALRHRDVGVGTKRQGA